MIPIVQPDLFGVTNASDPREPGLFAEIVLDRPLEHSYTYGVPDRMCGELDVGMRVLVPLGRGNRSAIGWCVSLTSERPTCETKEIRRILDERPLLDAQLLRL